VYIIIFHTFEYKKLTIFNLLSKIFDQTNRTLRRIGTLYIFSKALVMDYGLNDLLWKEECYHIIKSFNPKFYSKIKFVTKNRLFKSFF